MIAYLRRVLDVVLGRLTAGERALHADLVRAMQEVVEKDRGKQAAEARAWRAESRLETIERFGKDLCRGLPTEEKCVAYVAVLGEFDHSGLHPVSRSKMIQLEVPRMWFHTAQDVVRMDRQYDKELMKMSGTPLDAIELREQGSTLRQMFEYLKQHERGGT